MDVDFTLLREESLSTRRASAVAGEAALDLANLYEATVGTQSEGKLQDGCQDEAQARLVVRRRILRFPD